MVQLLDSLGYTVVNRGGLEFIGPKKEPVAELEAFVYKPRFRDAGYLADLLRPLFKGQFTMNRPVVAPVTARQASNAPKFIRAAKANRANPTQTKVVQVGEQFVGEVVFDGAAWQGRRYGKGYRRFTMYRHAW